MFILIDFIVHTQVRFLEFKALGGVTDIVLPNVIFVLKGSRDYFEKIANFFPISQRAKAEAKKV